MIERIRLVFFGSDHYAPVVLEAIITNPYFEIILIVSSQKLQPDKQSRLSALATKNAIPLVYWLSKEDPSIIATNLITLSPMVVLVADFGQIVPQEVIKIPKLGTVVIHPSILPKYRGTTPIQETLLNGDSRAGVSLLLMDTKVDHGPLLASAKVNLSGKETAPELYHNLFTIGAELLQPVVQNMVGSVEPQSGILEDNNYRYEYRLCTPPLIQDHSNATYTKRLNRDSGRVDWSKPPEFIERMIRAYVGWPGTWTTVEEIVLYFKPKSDVRDSGDRRVKILSARVDESGKLQIVSLQIEGKSPISWNEFSRGYLCR